MAVTARLALTSLRIASSLKTAHRKQFVRAFSKMSQGRYWNRTTSLPEDYDKDAPIIKEARIISISNVNDKQSSPLHENDKLPNAKLLAVGKELADFDLQHLKRHDPNVIFVSIGNARETLDKFLAEFSTIEWIHSRSAGIDHFTSETLSKSDVIVTNAKGEFSSSLAEYVLTACLYFAKNIPRLLRQQAAKNWETYEIVELRGATMGVVGYGSIGRACAKAAKAQGMKVIALRRNPSKTNDDPYCDVVYGTESINQLFAQSDYIVAATPLTDETRGMIGKEQFDHAKPDSVFMNVGRGPVVDEDALIDALKTKRLKGASMDVFCVEPLPETSELWEMDNVLVSPHTMDHTSTSNYQATEFFVNENLPRFVRGQELLNPVDKDAGY